MDDMSDTYVEGDGVSVAKDQDGNGFLVLDADLTEDGLVPSRRVLDITQALLLDNVVAVTDNGRLACNTNTYSVGVWGALDQLIVDHPPVRDTTPLAASQSVSDVIGESWNVLELLHTNKSGEFIVMVKYEEAARRVWAEGGVFKVVRVPRRKGKSVVTEFYLLSLKESDS